MVWLSGALLVLGCMSALGFGDMGHNLFGMIALAPRVQVINIAENGAFSPGNWWL